MKEPQISQDGPYQFRTPFVVGVGDRNYSEVGLSAAVLGFDELFVTGSMAPIVSVRLQETRLMS